MGLHRAGFDVTGVDIDPQPEYPFEFVQADALEFDLSGFDFVWASPPCQRYSTATRDSSKHPDLIAAMRRRLKRAAELWVIENVPGARRELRDPIMLCGAMFNLAVVRHRYFECSWPVQHPAHPKHKGSIVTGEYVTVAGNGGVPSWTLQERARRGLPRHIPGEMSLARWQQAMGIDWLDLKALTQAIPPAYAEWIGKAAQL